MKQYKIVYTDNIYGNNTVEASYYSGECYNYVVAEKHDEAMKIKEKAFQKHALLTLGEFANIAHQVLG